MNRPALTQLMDDIKAGKIHIVVVYKIDRLTRSLVDFCKLVEVFDQYQVTFVSITQSFNTTTSMGRLTLNMLLSFAQFEREVTGERIRDKIAATKKKGIWVGGLCPIGYVNIDKMLIPNTEEVKLINWMFERYLVLGCVRKLKQELDQKGLTSRIRETKDGRKFGGARFSRGSLYKLLKNPVYLGKITHKDQLFEGRHSPIVDNDLWDRVQNKLQEQAARPRGSKSNAGNNLLRGLLFYQDGSPYMPCFTNKNGKQYRYYMNETLIDLKHHYQSLLMRLPSHEIEQLICSAILEYIQQPEKLASILLVDPNSYKPILQDIALNSNQVAATEIVTKCIEKIIIQTDTITIKIKVIPLRTFLGSKFKIGFSEAPIQDLIEISIPYQTSKSPYRVTIIEPTDKINKTPSLLDLPPKQLRNFVKGMIWRTRYFEGETIEQISQKEDIDRGYIKRLIEESMYI
jgi:DNA invertase Pin-like site-specific DNA recombinase